MENININTAIYSPIFGKGMVTEVTQEYIVADFYGDSKKLIRAYAKITTDENAFADQVAKISAEKEAKATKRAKRVAAHTRKVVRNFDRLQKEMEDLEKPLTIQQERALEQKQQEFKRSVLR